MTAYENTLFEAFKNNPNLVVMAAENKAFLRNVASLFGDRFIDVGICEQNMFGVAAGLAMRGKVVLTHALANFLVQRPYEFIRTSIAFQNRNVKLVSAFSGILSEANGFTHQSIEDIALMRALPNMTVMSPACSEEMGEILTLALSVPNPVYIRYNHISWNTIDEELLPHEAAVEKIFSGCTAERLKPVSGATELCVGKYHVLREGTDVCILTHGILTKYALMAAEILEKIGVSVRVLYAPVVLPADAKSIAQSARQCKLIVVVEDQSDVGGVKDAVNQVLVNEGILIKVQHIGLPKFGFQPLLFKDVILHEKLDAVSIADKIEGNLET